MFLPESSVVVQINERRLKKNRYDYDLKVDSSVRNYWGLCVTLQPSGLRVALFQTVPPFKPDMRDVQNIIDGEIRFSHPFV